MLYAQVVLGIPVEGPFDYIVPANFSKNIKVGMRVKINFHMRNTLGYVVKLCDRSNIRNLKTILEVIDDIPVLDKSMLLLTKQLSDYYCCSWGEAIETALPEGLRKGRRIECLGQKWQVKQKYRPEALLVQDLEGRKRWDIYLDEMKETLNCDKSVIVLLADIGSVLIAKEKISSALGVSVVSLYRKQPKELMEWNKIKNGEAKVVAGTRSAIFAPLNDLGLIIIDEEQEEVYKQDQVPHYHAREVAFMRMNIEKVKLILVSHSPSLELLNSARRGKVKYILIPPKKQFPEIKTIVDSKGYPDSKQRALLSKFLEDSIKAILNSGGKILLFLNRKGFATSASCRYCGGILKCPRCNINLVYHYKENVLNCHYCNYKAVPPKICPNCNSSYIRYSGVGTEKIESELSRLFVGARIKIISEAEEVRIQDADIFVSTESIIKRRDYSFDLIGALYIDNLLSRVDFRASEKTFGLLIGLLNLTEKKLIIQTRLDNHHCLRALLNNNIDIFYQEELRQRKQLGFPPYQHIGVVKLRGKNELKVKEVALSLFKSLMRRNQDKAIKIISTSPGEPVKLRESFYRQIMIKSKKAKKISAFLKRQLKKFSHSGIIVTVDIDPL